MNSRVVKVVPKFKASHAIQWLPNSGCTLSHVIDLFSNYKPTERHPYEVFLTGRRGRLMITISQIEDRLQMYMRKGVFREVYPGFWIVVDDNMDVMVLSEQEFYDTHDFKGHNIPPHSRRSFFHSHSVDTPSIDEDYEAEWEAGTVRRNEINNLQSVHKP